MKVPGAGLAKGLAVTLRTMTRRSVTAQYPDVKPELPPRSRGVIALIEENCTVCMLCARECPAWCIYIDSHKETIPATTEGGRERQRNVLDRFAIDFSLCMYCGICIEVCPFDALFWSPEFEYAELDIRDLTHEKDRLRRVDVRPSRRRRPSTRTRARPKEIDAARRPPTGSDAAGPTAAQDGGVVTRGRGALRACSALVAVGVGAAGRHHAASWCTPRSGWSSPSARSPGCYLLLAAEFVAWVQVLIYVGAVVVLLLFALMLTRAPIGVSTDLDAPPLQRRGRRGGRARARRRAARSLSSPASTASASSWATTRSAARPRVGRRGHLPHLGAAVRGALACCCSRRWSARSCCPAATSGRRGATARTADAAADAGACCRRCCSASACTACWRGATRSWC